MPEDFADIKDCDISQNGEYIVILTNEDNIYEYEIVAEDYEGIRLLSCEDEAIYFGEIGAISVNDSGIICYNDINENDGGPRISYNILY